jgi:hypothetical protein
MRFRGKLRQASSVEQSPRSILGILIDWQALARWGICGDQLDESLSRVSSPLIMGGVDYSAVLLSSLKSIPLSVWFVGVLLGYKYAQAQITVWKASHLSHTLLCSLITLTRSSTLSQLLVDLLEFCPRIWARSSAYASVMVEKLSKRELRG